MYNCQNNCSNHGTCHYGYCTCDDGWYGYDLTPEDLRGRLNSLDAAMAGSGRRRADIQVIVGANRHPGTPQTMAGYAAEGAAQRVAHHFWTERGVAGSELCGLANPILSSPIGLRPNLDAGAASRRDSASAALFLMAPARSDAAVDACRESSRSPLSCCPRALIQGSWSAACPRHRGHEALHAFSAYGGVRLSGERTQHARVAAHGLAEAFDEPFDVGDRAAAALRDPSGAALIDDLRLGLLRLRHRLDHRGHRRIRSVSGSRSESSSRSANGIRSHGDGRSSHHRGVLLAGTDR